MGAHPARKQPPAARGRFHTLDPPLARPIRSLRHGQHGGHYHSGGERSRQPARERAPAAGTRLALALPPSFLSLPLPCLPTHSLRGAAGPRERAGLGPLQGEGAAAAPLRSPAGAFAVWQVPGAQVRPRPGACASASAARSSLSLGVPQEGAGQRRPRRAARVCRSPGAGREDVDPDPTSHHPSLYSDSAYPPRRPERRLIRILRGAHPGEVRQVSPITLLRGAPRCWCQPSPPPSPPYLSERALQGAAAR
ncbi:uncharacterized protein LOC116269148 [Papio anubis]|uniref:uncharacterized protein LOC116269148 n=1 Tax=Papio anubis TaxID=9555 RepID=UPI0012AE55D9|nr:uncharacterized protein LOC116269148 [Papio anubis]